MSSAGQWWVRITCLKKSLWISCLYYKNTFSDHFSMSIKSTIYERSGRQPAILSRKRKAEKELVLSPASEFSSPCSSSSMVSSCEDSPCPSCDENFNPADDAQHPSSAILSQFRGIANLQLQPQSNACRRACPLPELDWAEQKELWHSMVVKDVLYSRDCRVLQRHPDLEPRMRAILLDWLTEVCEVYRLHRETFYLALDYVDRYLLAKPDLPRSCLQLLGATALFVASKMEEIYPPKLEQFAFVTDGACTDAQILQQELVLIMTLNWNLTPVTINCWLNIFLQLAYLEDGENMIGPETFPKQLFIRISQVLDLCILDLESLKYSYSVLCASAMAHFISKETAMHVSGLSWSELLPCVTWLKPFVEVSEENGFTDLKYFSDVPAEDCHNIQTHTASLRILDQVAEKQRAALQENSPSLVLRELTPPQSLKKKLGKSSEP
ncbi:hypothetical protein JTE90_017349 [Oedothorax gibbosus]|uniref:Cyclin N-terminal domain-containing protein n=1 Tax=Oedothorax gibbosus TaxID=931172 RepID=A0AAV6VRV2_9ARAC|nr:hypothetical protein JTE90_017349 [Oedothorax gibbosus]